jgi:hypothetical protein
MRLTTDPVPLRGELKWIVRLLQEEGRHGPPFSKRKAGQDRRAERRFMDKKKRRDQ